MPIQNFVYRTEETHQYFDQIGLEYMSVSKFLEMLCPKFDTEMMAAASAKKRGVTKEVILQEWRAKAKTAQDHGNRIHNALEKYLLTTQIDEANKDLVDIIKTICSSYSGYYRVMPEEMLYDVEHRIAGTSDLVLMVTNSAKGKFDIEDFKTNVSKGIQFYDQYGKSMLHPLEHFENCNYNKYAMQLSIYAYMVEKLTGKKLRKMNILFIPPDNLLSWRRIPVPYMKKEVEAALSFYKNAIAEHLDKKVKMPKLEPTTPQQEVIDSQSVMPNFDL
jgi:hypothetical protein